MTRMVSDLGPLPIRFIADYCIRRTVQREQPRLIACGRGLC
jgi:hypothetical protein